MLTPDISIRNYYIQKKKKKKKKKKKNSVEPSLGIIYTFVVEHRPGTKNGNADALSRCNKLVSRWRMGVECEGVG